METHKRRDNFHGNFIEPAPDGFTMLGYLAPFLLSRLFEMASRSTAVALHLKSRSYACSVAVIRGDQRGVERL